MPRASTSKRQKELSPGVWAKTDLIGALVLSLVEKGAYVGVSHNYTLGVNLTVMYGDAKEKFYCEDPEEWDQLYKECEAWILEEAGTQPSKGKGKVSQGTPKRR